MATYKIAVLPGDGIGQEVTPQAQRILQRGRQGAAGVGFEFETGAGGRRRHRRDGRPRCRRRRWRSASRAHAILFGAVGGPKWDDLPQEQRPERGLLGIRKELDLFANLRPATCFPMLVDASPLKRSVVEGTDLMVIRELTGGLYFGEPRGREDVRGRRARAPSTPWSTPRGRSSGWPGPPSTWR